MWGHEKTELLMDAESGLWRCLFLFQSSLLHLRSRKEEKKIESGVKE